MSKEMQFKEFVSQYCDLSAKEITKDMRFREDLGFSSFDFMSFMGELEDNYDVEFEMENAANIRTIGEALDMLKALPIGA